VQARNNVPWLKNVDSEEFFREAQQSQATNPVFPDKHSTSFHENHGITGESEHMNSLQITNN